MNRDAAKKAAAALAFSLLGASLTFLFLEAGLRLAGLAFFSARQQRGPLAGGTDRPYTILCIGESTTAGQYPAPLEKELNRRSPGTRFRVVDAGMPGANSSILMSRLRENLDRHRPDMVVAMMGCNEKEVLYYRDIPGSGSWLFRNSRAFRFLRLLLADRSGSDRPPGGAETGKTPGGPRTARKGSGAGTAGLAAGREHARRGEHLKAEKAFGEAAALDPADGRPWAELSWLYRSLGRFSESERAAREAVKREPRNGAYWVRLSWSYKGRKEAEDREISALEKALACDPGNEYAANQLAWLYSGRKEPARAAAILERAAGTDPRRESFFAGLAGLYAGMGDADRSAGYSGKAEELRLRYMDPRLREAYLSLKRELDDRGIRLAAVQYPMRPLDPLKYIFAAEPPGAVLFVDNGDSFRGAVARDGYREYFMDAFGGDFGHCTEKGNELIAENIATAILADLF